MECPGCCLYIVVGRVGSRLDQVVCLWGCVMLGVGVWEDDRVPRVGPCSHLDVMFMFSIGFWCTLDIVGASGWGCI